MASVMSGLGVSDQSRLLPSLMRRAATALRAAEHSAPDRQTPVLSPVTPDMAAAGTAPTEVDRPSAEAAADVAVFPPLVVEALLSLVNQLAASTAGSLALTQGAIIPSVVQMLGLLRDEHQTVRSPYSILLLSVCV
jgi:hypothetical protein